MARGRVGSGGRLVMVAGFLVSAAVAGLISTRTSPRAPVLQGTSLTSLPAAFTGQRLPPLFDARRATRWAPVMRAILARRAPRRAAAPAGWVARRTPEGTANIVVSDGEVDRHDELWVRVRLSVLPNGTEGWVPRSALGGWSFVETRLVIDRSRFTASLLRAGRVIFRAPVGVGVPGTPTPSGTFYVRDRLTDFASPTYGPLAFGTNARSPTLTDWPAGGFIGIHGTNRPDLIPGRVSHGCIRLKNAAIVRLGELMPVGTPVTVR